MTNLNHQGSAQAYAQAKNLIPGGVNSPVRAFLSTDDNPVFIKSADGAYLYDVDGNKYLDFIGSWGALFLGHNHPVIAQAIQQAVGAGLSYGAPTLIETEMAAFLTSTVPGLEMVRMVNSGTEATMSAIRVARGYTGRNKFIKFEGCYHGHSDSLLVKAGSGTLTFGNPSSAGVTEGTAQDTLVATYNDLESVKALFAANPGQVACVIVEPVAGNMNCIPPAPGFHQGLRALCDQHGALLIFDEVMTGFRTAFGGCQNLFNDGVKPDLITLGKIIGGGMPVGAFGGRREVMSVLAPLGPVYQAGTLSGNPLAMAAGLAQLKHLQAHPELYTQVVDNTKYLLDGLTQRAHAANLPFSTTQAGGMFGFFFVDGGVSSYADALKADVNLFKKFFHLMLERGVYLAPSAFEAGFMSAAHTRKQLDYVLAQAEEVFAQLKA